MAVIGSLADDESFETGGDTWENRYCRRKRCEGNSTKRQNGGHSGNVHDDEGSNSNAGRVNGT